MDGYEVPIEALTASGEASTRVADGVRGVDLAAPVLALGSALPGGAVARSSAELGCTWAAAVTSVADGVARQGSALRAAASSYAEAEELAGAAMSGAN